MPIEHVPNTLALIPDGNRRWAKSNRLSLLMGYNQGVEKFVNFTEWCIQYGINNIVVWAFSTENFSRSGFEKDALFNIYKRAAKDKNILGKLHKNQVRVKIIGNKNLLPKDLRIALSSLEKQTKQHKERVLNMLIGYGGKDDILHAVKMAMKNVKNAAQISEGLFQKYLFSNAIPAVDFVIRTSGEHRLSGFMPWQTEYSELYFSKKLWPDFTKRDLQSALADYSKRQRRFGK